MFLVPALEVQQFNQEFFLLARTSASGGSATRIVHQFALGRYHIEVVGCRKGDRELGQLRTDVRLRNYLLE